MKKLILAVIMATSLIPISAHADTPNTNIAIIDTGYDPSVTQFAGKIVYEACFTNNYCPNGKSFQEGTGSAQLSFTQLIAKDATHGTQMLSASINTNPNTKFVYIRAYGIYNGYLNNPTDVDFVSMLKWINTNKIKLNIGAVVWSSARHITTSCPANDPITTLVNDLKSNGIPVISSAGNDYDYSHVSFPACLSPIIAVGSIDAYGHALYSNAGKDLDFDAMGTMTVSNGGNLKIQSVGTSLAAQVFAASWIAIKQAKPTLNYDQEYALIQSTQVLSKNVRVKDVPTLNLAGALK
jgi:subtilisin family serine protease